MPIDVARPRRLAITPARASTAQQRRADQARGRAVLLVMVAAIAGLVTAIWLAAYIFADPLVAPFDPRNAHPFTTSEPVPVVTAVTLLPIAADTARQRNAAVPFAKGPNPAARPFVFAGDQAARDHAATCLASAGYYEAGDDAIGEQAVMQVVLNRVRHPAFPASVCDVVFQGSQRSTGCQFTFTCDGSIHRRSPSPAAWQRARFLANRALSGDVFAPVGLATHYHTDWVVAAWDAQMDKIASVHTHLFYRWQGFWGTSAAFRQKYRGSESLPGEATELAAPTAGTNGEIDLAALGFVDGSHPATFDLAKVAPGVGAADLGGSSVKTVDTSGSQFQIALDPNAFPGSYAVLAFKLCGTRVPCRVLGWRNAAAVPTRPARPEALPPGVSFMYERAADGTQISFWNCREMARANAAQCLPGTGAEARTPNNPPADLPAVTPPPKP